MTLTNYTMQDVIGIFAGFVLFAFIFIPPGYMVCFVFNLFDFRLRKRLVRLGIAMLISSAITPAVYFLAYRLVSESFAYLIMFAFTVIFLFQFWFERSFSLIVSEIMKSRQIKIILSIIVVWVALVVISLIDIQIGGKQLYFNITAFDYQTRVSIIDAISRTGVPPANPSYYPGQPVKLTFLYYFWYVLCSLVDKLGGNVVDPRTSLMASVIWAGLITMGTIAFYLRLRNSYTSTIHWRLAILGIGLLAVSGLDVLGSTFYMIFPKYLYGYFIDGDIEHWNEQITAWIGTAMWTPHHLVSMLNCIIGWMLVVYNEKTIFLSRKLSALILAGFAFGSAFGLSAWVTLIFVLFWIYWIIARILSGERVSSIWILFIPGIIAFIAIFPFILDIINGERSGGGNALQALTLDIRWFRPAVYFIINTPNWLASTVNFLLLPLNYFLELGFFFLVGITWLQRVYEKKYLKITPLWREEIVLLGISVFLTSFTRSTLIANNDFGWRGWLPGQFILLIWGTDILSQYGNWRPVNWRLLFTNPFKANQIRYSFLVLIAFGVLTTLQDITLLRIWPLMVDSNIVTIPEKFRTDEYLGTKTYEARTLFHQIDRTYPESSIIQFNPAVGLNRATGLYRTRGTVFSFHSLYGIPKDLYLPLGISVAKIFRFTSADWKNLDTLCHHYKIDILIISDKDELWENSTILSQLRTPIYEGVHYIAFECGY